MWIARNKDNNLFLFNTNKPNRCPEYDDYGDGYIGEDSYWVCGNREGIEDYNEMYDIIQLPSSMFPNLKWEDEPIEVDIFPKFNNDICENNYIVLTKYYENYEEAHTWFINMLKRQEYYKEYSEEELEKVWNEHIHDEYSFDEIYAVKQCDGYSKILFPMGRHDNQHDYELVCETKEYIDSIINKSN